MIRFSIATVFPEVITAYCQASIIGRAQKTGSISIKAYNLRDWATDKHHTVDDRVFGGNPGMLLKIEPLYKAISELKAVATKDGFKPYVVATAASGTLFSQDKAEQWATPDENVDYIMLCGHYEGFDARISHFVDEFVSVGPYILTGGELPALIIVDSITRILPGVLGNAASAGDETTFTLEGSTISVDGEYPQYTTPASFSYTDPSGGQHTLDVPEILRSGHHAKISSENKSQRTKKKHTIK